MYVASGYIAHIFYKFFISPSWLYQHTHSAHKTTMIYPK